MDEAKRAAKGLFKQSGAVTEKHPIVLWAAERGFHEERQERIGREIQAAITSLELAEQSILRAKAAFEAEMEYLERKIEPIKQALGVSGVLNETSPNIGENRS